MASVTAGAALKKIATYILTDKKGLKIVGMIVGIVLFIVLLPVLLLIGLFGGTLNFDTESLNQMQLDSQKAITSKWDEIESKMTESGFERITIQGAQLVFMYGLYNDAETDGFVDKFVGCFSENQTDEQLIANINSTFNKKIKAEDYTKSMQGIRNAYIPPSIFKNTATKNNEDLVAWAKYAHEHKWGYVFGTYGTVLNDILFESKKSQYPTEVGDHAEFIKDNWLGSRTADCVGLIKGYSWFDPQNQKTNIGTNSMPDIGADAMYNNATEKGTIDTLPEIPGLAVWFDGHIGIYIGNGEVIDAYNTKVGVRRLPVHETAWTHWLKIPYIEYSEGSEG